MNVLAWIAVPAGLEGDRAVLRVLVLPDLDPAGPSRVRDEPIGGWPALLRDHVRFRVEISVGGASATFVDDVERRDDLQPAAWDAFFASDELLVMPRAQRRRAHDAELHVAPTAIDTDYISRLYPALAQPFVPGGPTARAVIERPTELPPWAGRTARATRPPPEADGGSQTVHFDRVVGLLREHPAVLRALGLIVELRFDAARLHPRTPPPHGNAPSGTIRVSWPDALAAWQVQSPLTHYEIDADRFTPRSTPDIKRGLVDLKRALTPEEVSIPALAGEPAWALTTFDVDAAVSALAHPPAATSGDGAGPIPPPPLRSAGIQLVRRDRHGHLERRRANAAENAGRDSRSELELDADDLVLGYRIDVKEENGPWLSLHRRRATYRVGATVIATDAPEEGHVKVSGAVKDPTGALWADGVVARWDGWSLSVPRPDFDHTPTVVAGPQRLPFAFHSEFAVEPRSLPRLRFGTRYELRCRVADLTGGGLGIDEPVLDEGASTWVRYARHELVAAPIVALAPELTLGPGGTLERLVLRGDDPGAADARLVLPPTATPALAEQHGTLDGDDAATFARVLEGTSMADPAAAGVTIVIAPAPGVTASVLSTDHAWGAWPELGAKRIELRARGESDDTPALGWEGATLVVRLAPAQRLELELSSNIRAELFGQFALMDWLGTDDATASNGRNPVVTPARTLELVHAVQRPLGVPVGPLLPVRSAAGETAATLAPSLLEPLLGLDSASTIRVDVSATWTPPGFGFQQSVACGVVASATLAREATQLPPLRHELGDTRHRRVTYTLTAVSRFREFWPPPSSPPDAEIEKAFLARTTLPPVSVVNSARPPAPIVLSTIPAFRFIDGAGATERDWRVRERTRAGGIVRVEVALPWFASGEEERLAVMAWHESPAPRDVWPFVSQVAGDPIWISEPPDSFLVPSVFGVDGVRATPVRLSETGEEVRAIPYDVRPRDDRRAYADIALPSAAGSSYCPFVTLAVARYQAHSIESLEISPVVRTEMVPLLPQRALRVERGEGTATVTLDGLGPDGEQNNRVVARLERFTGRPQDVFAADLVSYSSLPPEDGPPMWVPLAGGTVWGGLGERLELSIPASGGPYRIQVREVDQIPSGWDADPAEGAQLQHRTVFADTIVLPGDGIPAYIEQEPPAGGE